MINDNLSTIKVGDEVTIFQRSIIGIVKVDRITPTGLIGVGDELYMPKSGFIRGNRDSFSRRWIEVTTDEHRRLLGCIRLRKYFQTAKPDTLTLDQLRRIHEILKETSEDK